MNLFLLNIYSGSVDLNDIALFELDSDLDLG